jgi:hypothetical protein
MATRGTTPKRSPFAAVAETLTHVLVSTTAADHAAAFDLLEAAGAWPHYVKGERRPRPGHEGWIVEIQSRRRLSKAEFRDWFTQAESRREQREREAERRRRAEAEETAKREAEDRARTRRAMAVIAAAQAAAPPGPRAAYVYDEGGDKAERVPIVARAGVLFVRKSVKGSGYTIVHEPTGLGLAAPGREEVKTQKRAVELLERAARPAVVAALAAALRRRKGREAIEQFYAAWAADPPQAATAPPARRRERSASPFASAAGALAAAPGGCTRCNGSGVVQDGAAAVYCTCPLGQQLHDRELALAWPPAETERIVQFLDQRAAAEEDAGAHRALKAAARALRESGDVRDKAAAYLLRAASKGSAAARAALRMAADELARGAHLPPAPLPATAAEIVVEPAVEHASRRSAT